MMLFCESICVAVLATEFVASYCIVGFITIKHRIKICFHSRNIRVVVHSDKQFRRGILSRRAVNEHALESSLAV
jgi:hypothetical protein